MQVFIGGLPHSATAEQIREHCETVGPLYNLHVPPPKDDMGAHNQGYAFAMYTTRVLAAQAIEQLANKGMPGHADVGLVRFRLRNTHISELLSTCSCGARLSGPLPSHEWTAGTNLEEHRILSFSAPAPVFLQETSLPPRLTCVACLQNVRYSNKKRNKLYIGNLPRHLDQVTLLQQLRDAVPGVLEVDIAMNKDPAGGATTGLNRGFGFAEMYNNAAAEAARPILQASDFKLGGQCVPPVIQHLDQPYQCIS